MSLYSPSGAVLDVQQFGQGKPLVLLHSLLCDAKAFQHILPRLQESARVLLPSLPGYGDSPLLELGVNDLARQVVASITAAGVERFNLLGNGYGGFIALSIAQQFGERIDHLVLLDTAATFPPAGKEAVAAMKRNVANGGMAAVTKAALKRLFPDDFMAANTALVQHYSEQLLGFNSAAFMRACQNLIDVDLRARLNAVRCPTLVVAGLEDSATPPALSEELAKGIPGARLTLLPGCGHAPHIQAPDTVIGLIEDFMSLASEV